MWGRGPSSFGNHFSMGRAVPVIGTRAAANVMVEAGFGGAARLVGPRAHVPKHSAPASGGCEVDVMPNAPNLQPDRTAKTGIGHLLFHHLFRSCRRAVIFQVGQPDDHCLSKSFV